MTTSDTIPSARTTLATPRSMRLALLAILLVCVPSIAADNPKATGPLSPPEERFQGDWKAYGLESHRLEYAMTFEGRDFHVRARPDDKDRDEWYEGYIVLRTDEEPAQIDFVILVQSGERKLATSQGIFHFDGDTIVVKAPERGESRPRDFESVDENTPIALLRLSRDE